MHTLTPPFCVSSLFCCDPVACVRFTGTNANPACWKHHNRRLSAVYHTPFHKKILIVGMACTLRSPLCILYVVSTTSAPERKVLLIVPLLKRKSQGHIM